MAVNIETFLPAILKAVQRNKGIMSIWDAERTFSPALVKLALEKGVVGKRTIILDAKTPHPTRIKCITLDWDGQRPAWLDHYKKEA